jgi:hypothetical protein
MVVLTPTILVIDDDRDLLAAVSTPLELHFGRRAQLVGASDGVRAVAFALSARRLLGWTFGWACA